MAKLIIMLDGVTLNELILDQPRITLGRAPPMTCTWMMVR